MHLSARFSIASLLITPLAFAQSASTPPRAAAAWAAFLAENGPQWQVDWNPATGTPTDIWGRGLELQSGPITTVAAARNHANAVLARYSALLGQGPTTWIEDIQTKTRQVWIFGYRQEYQGLPCIGGRARIMINDAGVLALFGSSALAIPAVFSTVPTVDAEQALVAAYQSQGLEPTGPTLASVPAPRLVVWGDAFAKQPTPVRLAWEVKINRYDLKKVGRVYVDAQTSVVQQYVNDLHDCGFTDCSYRPENRATALQPRLEVSYGQPIPGATDVTGNVSGWINTGVGPNDPLQNLPLQNLQVAIQDGASAFTDAQGNFQITNPGTTQVNLRIRLRGRYTASVVAQQGTALDRTVAATPGTPVNITVYSPTPAEFDLSQVNIYWGNDSINQFVRARGGAPGQMDTVQSFANEPSSCNAFYTNYTTHFYNAAGGCVNTAYPSVIYHEWGHGLDDANGGLNQNEGMSEGSADFISIAILDDPLLGKDFFGPGTFVRTALNTRTYPAGGGVHQQGETWMGFGWDVYTNLTPILGKTAALDLFRDFAVGHYAANPSSQATGVRAVFVLDDDDGDLTNGTPNCNSLAAACAKRNLPNPAQCQGVPVYTSYGSSCPGSANMPGPCIQLNPAGGQLARTTGSFEYGYESTAPAGDIDVTGFRLWTRSATSSANASFGFYFQATGTTTPDVSPTAQGTVALIDRQGFYTCTFATPITVTAGKKFYVSMNHASTVSIPSNLESASAQVGTIHRRALFGTGAWSLAMTAKPGLEILCDGFGGPGAQPILTNTSLPVIGTSLGLDLKSARANAPTLLHFGASNSSWLAINLPYDLTPLGAAGCNVLASGEILIALTTDAKGKWSFSAAVPNNSSLVGGKFYNQAMVVDPIANAFGYVFSNAGEATIGKP